MKNESFFIAFNDFDNIQFGKTISSQKGIGTVCFTNCILLLQGKLKKIKEDIVKARHLQDLIRVTDLKDRSIMEHNFERVNWMSGFYVIILIAAGLCQVLLVRSLFDDKSKINPLWKKAFKD